MAAKKTAKKEVEVEVAVSGGGALDLVKKALIKKYGEVIGTLGDGGDHIAVPTISTGCLSLDAALGRGGMAFGRIYEIFGPNSGGKSTLADNVVIQAQRRGLKCLYIDAECSKDPELFRAYGGDTSALTLVQGRDGEENLDILEKLLKTGEYKVAVVDSVSALIPRVEAEADIEDQQMGIHARLMSKALRKINPIVNQNGVLLIFINQMRLKIGAYGNPETTTGGESLSFYASGRISVRGPEVKSRRIEGPEGEVIGHKTLFETVKNKLSAPFRKAEVNLIYGRGYDAHWEILEQAASIGVIDKSGAWYKYEGKNFAQGELNAVAFLKAPENKEIYTTIMKEVILQTGLKEEYELSLNPGPIYT